MKKINFKHKSFHKNVEECIQYYRGMEAGIDMVRACGGDIKKAYENLEGCKDAEQTANFKDAAGPSIFYKDRPLKTKEFK